MLMALLMAAASPAQVTTVPGWRIHASEPICFMETIYKDGTYLKVEYHPRQDRYYMLLANERWNDIQNSKRYDLEVAGAGRALDTRGSGIWDEDYQRGMIYIPLVGSRTLRRNQKIETNDSIEAILRYSDRLVVRRDGSEWLDLQLKGAPLALWETLECSGKYVDGGQPLARRRIRMSPSAD